MLLNLSSLTSLKIGPICDVKALYTPHDYNNEFLIGGGFNLLIGNNPPALAILDKKKFSFINYDGHYLHVGAAVSSHELFRFCQTHNLGGFEFLGKLPGSMGGLVRMNAGLKTDEIKDRVHSVELLSGQRYRDELGFEYRHSAINEPIFSILLTPYGTFNTERVSYFTTLRANQPRGKSAGSFFKNPPNDYAGRLIEGVGLKGHRIGDAQFSPTHANFLMNCATATFEDVITLARLAKQRVFDMYGIVLENEVHILEKDFVL